MDPRYQTPRELAGTHYEAMMQSKEDAMTYLSSPDMKVRKAAILICETTWQCGADSSVITACRRIAESDADDFFRIGAIGALGRGLSSSKGLEVSGVLANLALNSANSMDVRTFAYWALRQVQFGLRDVDFDTFLKGTIYLTKWILRTYPGQPTETVVKSNVLPHGRFPEGFWESADDIDWDFVRQFTRSS